MDIIEVTSNLRVRNGRVMKYIIFAAFAATIPAANWLIGNVGTHCVPNGPCLIPVGFGLDAPSGVLMIGLAFVLRDAIQEKFGINGAVLAIGLGSILSWLIAPSALVLASVAAFLLAELADLAVYTPLRKRRLWLAVLFSGLVGSIVDSLIFLQIAFGDIGYALGNSWGKMVMSIFAAAIIFGLRRYRA